MASLKEKTLILVYFYKTHQTEEGRGELYLQIFINNNNKKR